MYTEYYQWSDGYNSNSDAYNVNAGQTLHGSLIYLADQVRDPFAVVLCFVLVARWLPHTVRLFCV